MPPWEAHMIVDWARNSQQIHQTHRITDNAPEDRACIYKQEALYLKYLQNVLHYSDEQCWEAWIAIANGNAAKNIGDTEGQRKIYSLVRQYMSTSEYEFYSYANPLCPITIFRSEIDFLNKAPAPLWARQFWCALLVYYKFQRQNLNPQFDEVLKTRWVTSWAIRQVTGISQKYYSYHQDVLSHFQYQMPQRAILDRIHHSHDRTLRFFKPGFVASGGEIVCQLSTLQELPMALALLQARIGTCEECGAAFDIGPYTKRTLCKSCWTKKRRRDQAKSWRKNNTK